MTQPHHHDDPQDASFDPWSAQGWEDRYAGEQVWSGQPNGALVAEVTGMTPGRALDVGCGEGADAVWLAEQGWQVTAHGGRDRGTFRHRTGGRWLRPGQLHVPGAAAHH